MSSFRTFVPIGIKEAFDRLVKSALDWAQMLHSNYARINIPCSQVHLGLVTLPQVNVNVCAKQAELDTLFRKTARVVANARVCTMIEALEIAKPLVIPLRLYVLCENIKEYQLCIVCKIVRQINVFECTELQK